MTGDPTPGVRPDPATIKACCAVGYSSDLVSLLLGDSYHPGGLALSRRLLDTMTVQPGERLLDVAAGIGTTGLLAAAEYDVRVDGVDLSPANVNLANGAAAAREIARVLRPGGRVGITDITADPDRLPAELTGLTAWVACVADARPAVEYERLLEEQGLVIIKVEDHHSVLDGMIGHVEARLELLRMTARPRLEARGVDVSRTRPALDAARAAALEGILGYVLIVAQKPEA